MKPIRHELVNIDDLWTYLGLMHDELWKTTDADAMGSIDAPAFHIALSVIETVRTMILNEELK